MRGDTDPDTGLVTVMIKIPGVMANGDGRYITGGDAFFGSADLEDKVTQVLCVDVDNVLGYGANTPIKAFHDDEVDEANAGWYIGIDQYSAVGNASFVEIKPLGGYAFVPAELYLVITAKKDPANKVGTFYCNVSWGKKSSG